MKRQGRPSEYQSAIISIVKGAPKGTHLTAPEVFAQAQKLGLPVSISTVYRTLHRLKVVGDLSTVSGDRKLRYEAAEEGPEHDHLICLGCGLTIEFIDPRLANFGQTVAKRKGFLPVKCRFDILGYCTRCRETSTENIKLKIDGHWQSVQIKLKEAVKLLNQLTAECTEDSTPRDLSFNNQALIEQLKQALEHTEAVDKLLSRSSDFTL